jgi:hypothetical protein
LQGESVSDKGCGVLCVYFADDVEIIEGQAAVEIALGMSMTYIIDGIKTGKEIADRGLFEP